VSSPRKISAAKRVQYGALPYRLTARSRPQFMLVTSRETRRWIIPKGWPKKGKSPHHSGRASSPSGLREQAGHMTASDLCAARQMISCQAGAIHT
jgi:hypothetical protein